MKILTAATAFSLFSGAASMGCQDDSYENEMDIAKTGATFHYTVVPDSAEGIGDGGLKGCLEAEHDGWMAFGFSSNGKMLGTDGPNHTAVVGGWGDVGKFDLITQASSQPLSALQTLEDASYENVDGKAILKFTKLLVEEGEVPIILEGYNYFLYALGDLEVAMGFHTVYGLIPTDFAAETEVDVPEVVASEGCPELENEMNIAETGATFHYTVVPDSAEGVGDGVLKGCLEAEHEGWMAFGFSSDGKMLGTDGPNHAAVVGGWGHVGPDVGKFDLITQASSQPPSALQTLEDASYENVDGKAILKFTKLLVEEGEVPINVEGDNFFLYAWGDLEVAMGFHSVYGFITKDFAIDVDVPEPTTKPTPEPSTKSGAVSNVLSAGTMAMTFGAALML